MATARRSELVASYAQTRSDPREHADYSVCVKVLTAARYATHVNITLDDLRAIEPRGDEVRR
jgi:hypothetical protein